MKAVSILFVILFMLVFGIGFYGSYYGWLGQSKDVSQSIRAISAGRGYSDGNVK